MFDLLLLVQAFIHWCIASNIEAMTAIVFLPKTCLSLIFPSLRSSVVDTESAKLLG